MSETGERAYPARPLLAVSLAVFRDETVLLTERTLPPMTGYFSLPGGLVEPGETLAEAALRELREEVAVDAKVIGFNRHVEVIERDEQGRAMRHYVIASFVASWIAGQGRAGSEAASVTWARREDLGSLRTTPHLLPLLDAAWAMVAKVDEPC